MEAILIVDDEPEVLALTTSILRAEGYTIVATGDPREALRIARSWNAGLAGRPIYTICRSIARPTGASAGMSCRRISTMRITAPKVMAPAMPIISPERFMITIGASRSPGATCPASG